QPNRAHNGRVASPHIANKPERGECRENPVTANVAEIFPRGTSAENKQRDGKLQRRRRRIPIDFARPQIAGASDIADFQRGADRAIIELYAAEEAADTRELGRRADANRRRVQGWIRPSYGPKILFKPASVSANFLFVRKGTHIHPIRIVDHSIFKLCRNPTAVIVDGARATKHGGYAGSSDARHFHGPVIG